MRTVSLTEANKHFSRLVDQAAAGDPFIITKFGKPLVKVEGLVTREPSAVRRLGFLAGQITVPPDFDRMGALEIQQMFGIP